MKKGKKGLLALSASLMATGVCLANHGAPLQKCTESEIVDNVVSIRKCGGSPQPDGVEFLPTTGGAYMSAPGTCGYGCDQDKYQNVHE
jgi:hypothetical protein